MTWAQKNARIDYTNWRGERRVRVIRPTGIMMFMATESHPKVQWLMEAFDPEDGKTKYFAVKDIHSWEPEEETHDDAKNVDP